MNDRKILAYHHQFDILRTDSVERLYETLDLLEMEVRGCMIGFKFNGHPGTLVDFFKEESRRTYPTRRTDGNPPGYRPRIVDTLLSRVCMTVDLNDGYIRSLGFPRYLRNVLWFPVLKERLLESDVYSIFKPIRRN